MAYESETADNQVGLDDKVWPKVFEKYEQFLKDVRFRKGDEELQFSKTIEPFCRTDRYDSQHREHLRQHQG